MRESWAVFAGKSDLCSQTAASPQVKPLKPVFHAPRNVCGRARFGQSSVLGAGCAGNCAYPLRSRLARILAARGPCLFYPIRFSKAPHPLLRPIPSPPRKGNLCQKVKRNFTASSSTAQRERERIAGGSCGGACPRDLRPRFASEICLRDLAPKLAFGTGFRNWPPKFRPWPSLPRNPSRA